MCRSRRDLSNAYLLAKFGFDTAENEPSKVATDAGQEFLKAVSAVEVQNFASSPADDPQKTNFKLIGEAVGLRQGVNQALEHRVKDAIPQLVAESGRRPSGAAS